MIGALSGLRVLDFGQYVAGPLTALMLADQGAEVIRIDPPGGPRWNTPANAFYQRGKRSLVLDLKQPADLAVARRLAGSADVLIENFRPGVMDRLGLGAEAARALNPRLIYCSLPGFAANDPRHAVTAWEGVVMAAGNGYLPPWSGAHDRPLYTALPLASSYAAFLAATAITLALYAREGDGHGRRIEVPLFDALFQAFGAFAMSGDDAGSPAFSSDIWGAGCYRCADRRWVMWATHSPRFMEALVSVGGVPEWHELGLLDRPRLAADKALLAELRRRVAALFNTRPAAEWEEKLSAAGAPLALVRSPQEWMETSQARDSQAVVQGEDPTLGPLWQVGYPVHLSATPPQAQGPRRPLDADRDALLAKPASPASAAPTTSPLPRILAGLRVVDLTQVLAGPTAARLLAEFGAEIIKINDPANPPQGYRYHLDVNRGKRTLLLDLKQPAGREVLLKLAGHADVVLQNFADGVPERLGIGAATLRIDKPDLIHATVSAYGQQGPWGSRRGYEPLGQAMVGMQWRFGGADSPLMEPLAVTDYGTGILAAFAIGLALYHRARGGGGQAVEVSLAQTGTYLQTPFLQLYPGKSWDEPSGQEALGAGPLQRLYRAANGWCFLGARESDGPALCQAMGLDSLSEVALASAFATASVEFWCTKLWPLGIGLHGCPTIQQLINDPWVCAQGLSITRAHEGVGSVTGIGPSIRMAPSPPVPGEPVRPPGADGRAVLAAFGYDAAVLDQLEADRILTGSIPSPARSVGEGQGGGPDV